MLGIRRLANPTKRNLRSLTMFSTVEPSECSVCSTYNWRPHQAPVCAICREKYFPQLGRIDYRFITRTTGLCCCCLTSTETLVGSSVWVCVCTACRFNPKDIKDPESESQASFLRLDPSQLGDNFRGDVHLTMDGSALPIQAHRFILASKSPVFRRMLEIDMSENISGKIHISDISAPVVRAAIECMYTGEIVFTEKVTPQEALRFAHKYEISWLTGKCERQLLKMISAENILEMLSISCRYGAPNLLDRARQFFSAHPEVHVKVLDQLLANFG